MNFVDDDCMVMFTEGQVERMNIALMEARQELLGPLSPTNDLQNEQYIVDISPNPAVHSVTITFEKLNKPVPYSLINSQGQLVQKGLLIEVVNPLSIAHLSKGLYWITLYLEEGQLTKKLLLH